MSNLRTKASLVGLGIVLLAGSAQAQLGAKAGGAPLSAGSTAGEVTLDGSFTSSLLRFGEANKAWKFGANVNIGRVQVPGPNNTTFSNTTFDLGGLVGRREYSAGTGAFRPFTGYGASLGFADNGQFSTFGVGPYFEIGGAYFVTPRFSIGATSNAAFQFEIQSPDVGDSSTGFALSGSLISLMATIYF